MEIETRWDMLSAEPIEIAPGVAVPARFQASVRGLPAEVTITAALIDGRYECEELTVRRRGDGEPVITSELLREVPVARIIRMAAETAAFRVEPPKDLRVGRGPDDDVLERVALAYRFASLFGEPPTRYVSERLGLTQATAKRWVSLARERGYLPSMAEQLKDLAERTGGEIRYAPDEREES